MLDKFLLIESIMEILLFKNIIEETNINWPSVINEEYNSINIQKMKLIKANLFTDKALQSMSNRELTYIFSAYKFLYNLVV